MTEYNCPNCGAPATEPVCPYCGTPILQMCKVGPGKKVRISWEDDGRIVEFEMLVDHMDIEQNYSHTDFFSDGGKRVYTMSSFLDAVVDLGGRMIADEDGKYLWVKEKG